MKRIERWEFDLDNPADVLLRQKALKGMEEAPVPQPPDPDPDTPQPSDGVVIYHVDALGEHLSSWFISNSPETAPGTNRTRFGEIVPESKDGAKVAVFRFKNADKLEPTVGLRLKYGSTPGWADFKAYQGQTVEFFNAYYFPQMLQPIHGQGNGWITAGWQFKVRDDANAALAMNAHQDPEGVLRWYLQGNNVGRPFLKPDFPPIPINEWIYAALVVHFDADPAKGWAELRYAGDVLKMTGQTMHATGGLGPYIAFYGQGVTTEEMWVRETVITRLD